MKRSMYTLSCNSVYTPFAFSTKSAFERELVELHRQIIPHFLALDVGIKICQEQLCSFIRDDHATFLVKNTPFKEEVA